MQLTEPLVPGQHYAFICMLSHLEKSVVVKNIQLAFVKDELDEGTNEPLFLTPTLSLDRWIPSDGKWYRWTGQFTASDASSFLLIGNFNSDADSQVKFPSQSNLRFGYYYLDLVRLFKIPPILKTPASDSPLSTFIPKEGEIVTLGRIYFEYDRTDFMPQALIQLKQLLAFIQQHPTMKIEIIGHTDIAGTTAYNMDLSERRSKAVLKWLISKGITQNRLMSSGKGSTEPIETNETAIGRSHNRRVEIKVIRV
ncbi:MAG: OmpA family protein [Saprospiraceae bacterium]